MTAGPGPRAGRPSAPSGGRCSPAVYERARRALSLRRAAASGGAHSRLGALLQVDGDRVLALGAHGWTRLGNGSVDAPDAAGAAPAIPGAALRPGRERGCAAAIAEAPAFVLVADLLVAGVTCLVGAPQLVGRLLAAIVLDVLSGRWASPDELVLVGFGGDVPQATRVVAVDSIASALERRRGDADGIGLVAVAPGASRDDASLAAIIGLAGGDTPSRTALLLPVAHPAAGLLAVVVEQATRCGSPALFLPAGASRQRGSADEPQAERAAPEPAAGDAGSSEADDVPFGDRGVVEVVPPTSPAQRSMALRVVPGRRSAPGAAKAVEVAVLGPVTVRGAEHAFERRPTLTELVAYLALHREGTTTAIWSTAVWPERRVPTQTVANRLSEARRALGRASDGLPRLRRRADRHVLVEVTTDWDRFRQLAARGDVASRRSALALVRGRPFANLRNGYWTVLEGLEGDIVASVTACARDLGEAMLAERDADGATWAANQGLRVAPWDERLHRLLMRAADADGNRAGVDAVIRQLALLLESEGDPLRAVHPETAALYTRLTSRSRHAAALGSSERIRPSPLGKP
jgi:DNA-binding SARP family transcriptional activator